MITLSDKTFNAFFFVVQLLLWLSRYAKHVFSDSATTTATTTTTHELVAFVWLLLGAQLESAVREVRQRQTQTSAVLAVIVVVAAARAVTALLCYCGCDCCCYYPSLPPTQQRELTTAFILGHFACCVRTLCWPLSGRRRFAIVRGNWVKSE